MKKTLTAALTTALVVGAASTTFAAANPFSDVPADHWAYDAVAQLADDGVIEGYGDGTEVLHGVSFDCPKGGMTAIVGPSGSGKSTIARLIASFWAPSLATTSS